jgi:hypothetical protein
MHSVVSMLRRLPIALVLALVACSARQKAGVTETAFENDKQRSEMIEATLRVMDAHPEYVDELFRMSRTHPRTQSRLFSNTAAAVADPDFAQRVARHLVAYPRGLERIMIETLDAARGKPDAQRAIVDAIEGRADVAAAYLVEHPRELATVSEAIVKRAMDDPDTKGKMAELVKRLVD